MSMPMTITNTAVAPGWYNDPMNPAQVRWWSGQDWTHHVQTLPRTARPVDDEQWTAVNLLIPRQKTMALRALVWGIVAVVIDPLLAPSILAIIYGAMALRRAREFEMRGQAPVGRGRAIAGIALGTFGAVFTVLCVVVFALRFSGRA
jgi:hypothetical protein